MGFNRLYESSDIEGKFKTYIANGNIDNLINNNYYEYHYFLSPLRHNLFNWYPFKKDGKLLEIGSGYGQLSGLFAKKVNQVYAIEDSMSKVEIISNRVNDINVIHSPLDKFNFDEKFDYIVLCNVFEYAKSFHDCENPYENYLKYLKTFLKEDGVILLALSNRLGLKYFSGFKEEHTNQYFLGIDGFNNRDVAETFSKKELISLIEKSGFSNYKFFYPYPNHEFPQVINTDKFVNKIIYDKSDDYINERTNFFRENKLNYTLSKDNLSEFFSNSFLVEIRNSNKKFPSDSIDFVKLNLDRIDEFKTTTIFLSNNTISKIPMSKKAENHIKKIYENKDIEFGKFKNLNCNLNDKSLYYNFLNENSFENLINKAIDNHDEDNLFTLLEKYYDTLLYNSEETNKYMTDDFKSIFKTISYINFHCHEKSNLDVVFSKVFTKNDEYIVSGSEWIFDFKIPLEFIFYIVINHQIRNNVRFKEFITLEKIFHHFDLDVYNIDLFKSWESNFMEFIHGNLTKPIPKIIPKENLDLPEKVNEYIQLSYDENLFANDKRDQLKKDIVINQRNIINKKNLELEMKVKELEIKDKEIKKKNKQLKNKNKEFNDLINSSSWKITKPLRKLKLIFNRWV